MGAEMAGLSAGQSHTAPFVRSESHRPDAKSLALAVLATGLLFVLIIFLPRSSRLAEPARRDTVVLAVQLTHPPSDVSPQTGGDGARVSVQSEPPAPVPRAALPPPDFAILPVPESEPVPMVMPQLPVRNQAPVMAEGQEERERGSAIAAGDGVSGSGGDGLGGKGSGSGRKFAASWAPEMNFAKLNAFFPKPAIAARTDGVAVLRCRVVRRNRVRNCSLVSENPAGLGFGQAALDAETILRVQVHDQNGRQVHNEWILFEAVFRLPAGLPAQG